MPEDWNAHRQALTETQAWCALKLDIAEPATSLRDAALEPADYPEAWLYGVFHPDIFETVIQARRQLLLTHPTSRYSGRILCVFGGSDTAMGEGNPVSDGVIDAAFLPPWDTWFALLTLDPKIEFSTLHLLLAWIPLELTHKVQRAIDVSASQALAWLSDRFEGDCLVARTFRQAQEEFGLSPA
jgi:hypothetical protein